MVWQILLYRAIGSGSSVPRELGPTPTTSTNNSLGGQRAHSISFELDLSPIIEDAQILGGIPPDVVDDACCGQQPEDVEVHVKPGKLACHSAVGHLRSEQHGDDHSSGPDASFFTAPNYSGSDLDEFCSMVGVYSSIVPFFRRAVIIVHFLTVD